MKFKKFLEENFVGLDSTKTDQDYIRLAIIAEHDATNLYNRLASKSTNERVKKVLLDISREEKVHIGELTALLREIDVESIETEIEGEDEISDL
jgi:rubrerythrin